MADDSEYKRIAEAALFASGRALKEEELARIMGVGSIGYVNRIMELLISDIKSRDGALEIRRIGNTYVLEVKSAYAQKVSELSGAPDITRPSLKILAYISKNEPMMQSALIKSFGSSAYEHIKELTEKGFIHTTKSGRTRSIQTTNRFKEYFEI